MDRFSFRWASSLYLPDNRLLQVTWTRTVRGLRCDLLSLEGHVHHELTRDLHEYFRHMTSSGAFEMFPERGSDPPEFFTNYVRVDPVRMPLRTFGIKITGNHYLLAVRADMMSAAACDEMNDHLLPSSQGAMRSRVYPETAAEPSMDTVLDGPPEI